MCTSVFGGRCVCHGAHVGVKDNSVESILSFFMWTRGTELLLSGFLSKSLYPLTHPPGPWQNNFYLLPPEPITMSIRHYIYTTEINIMGPPKPEDRTTLWSSCPIGRWVQASTPQSHLSACDFFSALLIIAELQDQPRCPSSDEWKKCGVYAQWTFLQP